MKHVFSSLEFSSPFPDPYNVTSVGTTHHAWLSLVQHI